jgi:amino acid transporter
MRMLSANSALLPDTYCSSPSASPGAAKRER